MCNDELISEYDISIVQGDDYNIVYQFKDLNNNILDNTVIKEVYMSCKELNYQKLLEWNDEYEGFSLFIPSTVTENFEQTVTNYDLTVYYINNLIETEIYEAKLTILLKRNKVVVS